MNDEEARELSQAVRDTLEDGETRVIADPDGGSITIKRVGQNLVECKHSKTPPPPATIGRMLVYVGPDMKEGPILAVEGAFDEEVRDGGWDISDHEMDLPTDSGLLIFEGMVEYSGGPDPDVSLRGEWRRLLHWEMVQVGNGYLPWD